MHCEYCAQGVLTPQKTTFHGAVSGQRGVRAALLSRSSVGVATAAFCTWPLAAHRLNIARVFFARHGSQLRGPCTPLLCCHAVAWAGYNRWASHTTAPTAVHADDREGSAP